MERVQQGMYQVVNGNWLRSGIFNSAPYVSAGKTGTAGFLLGENKSRQGRV